jgi:methionyl-tRNA formyltransferase
MKELRIVFFGTPDFAVGSLKALVDADFKVAAVVTATDKPSGRGHKMQSPPVKVFADENNIPCLQPKNLKDPLFIQELQSFKADLQIVVAFRMLPEIVWNMPELGTYNVHASLLPNYRGAAPINWAIINGEKTTGVSTFKLKHEIDTGSVLLQREVSIDDADNVGTVHDKLMVAGAELLVESVTKISEGKIELKPQDLNAVNKEAPKIFKQDCQIGWNLKAFQVRNFIRGMSPFPTAFAKVSLKDGSQENWKIYSSELTEMSSSEAGIIKSEDGKLLVSCSDYWLEITQLQSPGKKRMTADEFMRGLRVDLKDLTLDK